jgi:hypothetical protein
MRGILNAFGQRNQARDHHLPFVDPEELRSIVRL